MYNNTNTINNKGMITMFYKELTEDFNNSTTNNKEMIEMTEKLFEIENNSYDDVELEIVKDEDGKVKVIVSFAPEENSFDWRYGYIQDFAAEEKELAEKALTSEEEADCFAEIIREEYNEYCDPTLVFYTSLEEIKQDIAEAGIENVEIIVKDDDPDAMFVDIISSQDIQVWREDILCSRNETYLRKHKIPFY